MFRSTTLRAVHVGLVLADRAGVACATGGCAGRVRRHRGRSPTRAVRRCRASRSRSPASSGRPSTPSSPTSPGCTSRTDSFPAQYEVKAELASFKTAVVPKRAGQRRRADAGRLQAGGRATHGDRGGHRRIAAAQDRPRRRGDDVRHQRQLTELPVLDRNFTKFILLTPGAQQLGWQHAASENPQGSTQTR